MNSFRLSALILALNTKQPRTLISGRYLNLYYAFKKEIFPISIILILALSRLLPHPPNFTPIVAVAIIIIRATAG